MVAFFSALGTKQDYTPSPDDLNDTILRIYREGIILIARDGQQSPVGLIAGQFCTHQFNTDVRVLTEVAWWIPEASRGQGVGSLLLKQFLAEGHGRGLTTVVSLEHNSPLPKGYLEKYGMRLAEKTYILEA